VLLNWFTIFSQILNFLILVWLLKRFLYDRILQAMDEREKRVQSRMEEAESRSREAERQARDHERQRERFESKRAKMLEDARAEADEKRRELMHKAREDVDSQRRRWEEAVRNRKQAFLRDLRKKVAEQVFHIGSRAMADLADAELEERIAERFADKIKEMTPEQKKKVAAALQGDETGALIRSSFELKDGVKERITALVREQILRGARIHYEIDKDLLAGVELRCPGVEVSWSMEQYLASLEEEVGRELEKESQ